MIASLQGKKTYLIVGFVVLGVLIENFAGIDLPGFEPSATWLTDVLAMLGLGALRAGVTKAAA